MELYQLRTFVAVAQAGNLSRAAQGLNASQPAVSAHIKALEEELGVELFARSAKGMALTDPGRRLLGSAQAALDSAQRLLDQARDMAGAVVGDVRLGRNSNPEFLRLSAMLDHFASRHPKALVHIDCHDSYDVPQVLQEERLDAGFAYGSRFAPHIRATRLGTAPLLLVGPKLWQADIEAASIEDLAGMPWVWFNKRCPFVSMACSLLGKDEPELNTAAVINDENTILDLVAKGHGLSLLRQDMALEGVRRGGLVIWPGEGIEIPINILVLARRAQEPGVRALVEAAKAVWGQAS